MSEKDSLIKDTESREKIISDINKNIFVEAGAGSGKTTMLVNRMVAMVESGVPIERICAITFTKAAAGEFYERFQRLLIERSNPDCEWEDKGYAGQLPKPTKASRQRCEDALQHIDLCFMGTIDAFCAMVLSEHPSEAGIPSDAVLVSDEEAEEFYRQQYVKICKGEYGDELKEAVKIFNGMYWNADEVFAKGMSVFMGNRNVDFRFPRIKEVDIDKVYAADRAELISAVQGLTKISDQKYEGNKASIKAWGIIDDIRRNVCKKWSANLPGVIYALKKLKDIKLIPEAMVDLEPVLSGLFVLAVKKKSLNCVVGEKGGILERLLNVQYCTTMAFLKACVPCLEKAMRDKGYMTYFDYLYYLREMLKGDAVKKDGKLIEHIYERHSYFLIDEFQDTNPLQAEIFFYLTCEHPVEKWSECMPRPGSLFIVGDPKQSIYRFRGADVTSFLKVRDLFEKGAGEVLSLSRNFRSTKQLCEFFNRSFTEVLKESIYQSEFEEIPLPDEKPDEFTGIFTYEAYKGELEKEHPDETDPVQIANIIERLVDSEDHLIRTGNDKEPRRIRYSDIMVITYGKKKLGTIMACLDSRDIPSKVEGQVPFGANEALIEIGKICSAVAYSGDVSALYGALTGKVFGFTKEDIRTYCEIAGKESFRSSFDAEKCKNETARNVAETIEKLKRLHNEYNRLSPAAVFSKIMDDNRIYEYIKADKLEAVYYALELIRNAETAGTVASLKEGADFIEGLIAGMTKEERCLSLNEDRDAVHLANLHKVKGLEAPVVILSSATKFNNSNDKMIRHSDEGSEGYIFKLPKNSSGSSKGYYFETCEFKDEEDEEKEAGKAENNRLVYVAATRARNALIICDSIKKTKCGESKSSIWKSSKEEGRPDIFAAFGESGERTGSEKEKTESTGLYETAKTDCVLNDRSAETGTYVTETPSRLPLVSKISDRDEMVVEMQEPDPGSDDEEKESYTRKFPALLGTMVHKLMEMMVSSKNKGDVTSTVDEIIREYRTPEMDPHLKEMGKALSDVAEHLRSGGYPQNNDAPQDILKTLLEAEEVCCEVPFSYCEEGAGKKVLWNGIMDVVYLKDGKWHIVDYKTNADGSDLDRKYREQLKAYVKAFKETTGEDADAMTYHIDI